MDFILATILCMLGSAGLFLWIAMLFKEQVAISGLAIILTLLTIFSTFAFLYTAPTNIGYTTNSTSYTDPATNITSLDSTENVVIADNSVLSTFTTVMTYMVELGVIVLIMFTFLESLKLLQKSVQK
jgi:hypothetical protein